MWELLESIIYYFKYKRWSLPLFVIFLLILLTLILSFYSQNKEVPLPEVKPTEIPTEMYVEKSSDFNIHQDQKKDKSQDRLNIHPVQIEDEKEDEQNEPQVSPTGNVSHFKDSLTDSLKIEGLDQATSEKIFKHMRSQLDEPEKYPPYSIEDSVRYVLPEASDSEVYRITELISKTAAESFYSSQ